MGYWRNQDESSECLNKEERLISREAKNAEEGEATTVLAYVEFTDDLDNSLSAWA